jgi:hypothetical protein
MRLLSSFAPMLALYVIHKSLSGSSWQLVGYIGVVTLANLLGYVEGVVRAREA